MVHCPEITTSEEHNLPVHPMLLKLFVPLQWLILTEPCAACLKVSAYTPLCLKIIKVHNILPNPAIVGTSLGEAEHK